MLSLLGKCVCPLTARVSGTARAQTDVRGPARCRGAIHDRRAPRRRERASRGTADTRAARRRAGRRPWGCSPCRAAGRIAAAGLVKASHRSTNSFPYPQYRTTVYRNSMSAREPLAFARSAGRQYPVIGALLLAQQQGGTRATDCLRNHAPRKPLGCDQPDRSVSVGLREGAPLPCMIARST
jgi:hypothetical protein